MAKLAQQIKDKVVGAKSRGNTAYNYFISFVALEKQKKYKKFGDVKAIHERIVEATQRHLQNLMERSVI